jgi:hypothetical protein
MRDYRKIEAWKLADDLTVVVYERTRSFPKDELYGLTSQLRRALFGSRQYCGRVSVRKIIFISSTSPAVHIGGAIFHPFGGAVGYLSSEEVASLHGQTKVTFGCLRPD